MKSAKTLIMLIIWALMSVWMTACEMHATTPPPPTPTAEWPANALPTVDPTMDALGTQLSLSHTQTAEAFGAQAEPPPTETPAPFLPNGSEAGMTGGEIIVEATPTPMLSTTECSNPYVVKANDWIYKIASVCQVEPSALIAANPGINPDYIVPGQQLNMPPAGATAVPPATPMACSGTHTVVAGENLFRIAYNCGLTTEELAQVNGLSYPYHLRPGDVLRFP